ncbi:SRPBCC family protein [Acuticoccus sp. I52.16.1]|uniref:SRPBCC family protein n=1 Tax=Acuticoccus sp. I52.16.1 TaxID=2928472 RepID=UPI001FD214F4|nr:SRPBCC family protein [Acuticoccus sp. I52.16.1]UOM36519.1 SRPBCC family protein [Acuticoccus sp. I52.16.1]
MSDAMTIDAYGAVIAPATFKIERLLPGPIERVWDYLTNSDLRRQWLASGDMTLEEDAPFTLTWRNEELLGSGPRPEGMSEEHSMDSRIIAVEPPRRLVFAWKQGEVSFTLAPVGDRVLLTLVHSRVSDRANLTSVSAGWHAHLGVLAAALEGTAPTPFWPTWQALRADYEARIPE